MQPQKRMHALGRICIVLYAPKIQMSCVCWYEIYECTYDYTSHRFYLVHAVYALQN